MGEEPMRRGRRKRDQDSSGDVKPGAFNPANGVARRGVPLLTAGEVQVVRRRALDLLADYGVVVIHPVAQEAMRKAGAQPGAGADRYRLPRELVEEAVAALPKSVTLCGKRPRLDMTLPRADGGFVMRTGTGAHGYVDPRDASYRKTDLKAVREMAAVGSALDQLGFVAHPFVHGVPEVTADLHSFATMVSHTDKHCWIQPYAKENVDYLMRIAAVAAGGEDALKKRPIASMITCSFSPLEFKYMDTEAIIQAGRVNMPLHACSLPSAGGSAPLTQAGSVLMAVAEILGMGVLAHLLAPGTPVIATPLMFTLDMRTGSALQSAPESIRAAAMAIQVMKEAFGLPAHTYGAGSDTPDVDHQSMAERSLIGAQVLHAGADILGGVGQLECATVFSPVQAVLDNEVGTMLRGMIAPVDLSDAAMNWDEVNGIRVGGHFLDSAQTLEMCRSQYQPEVFLRQGRDDYEKSGRRTAFDVAREFALEAIKKAPEEGVLDEDQRREIAGIVAAGDDHIVALNAAPGAVGVI